MLIDGKVYLTTKEAAAELSISTGRVRQLIADGTFNSRKIGNSNLIPVGDVSRYQATRQPPGRKKDAET